MTASDISLRTNPDRDGSLSGTKESFNGMHSFKDADKGDSWTKFEIKDNTGVHNFYNTASNQYIDATSGYVITRQAWNDGLWASLYIMADASDSTQTLQIRAHDGRDWGEWSNFTLTTGYGLQSINRQLQHNQSNYNMEIFPQTPLSAYVSYSDPNGDSVVKYEIKDTTGIQNFHNYSLYNYANPHLTNTELDASNGYVFNADQLHWCNQNSERR